DEEFHRFERSTLKRAARIDQNAVHIENNHRGMKFHRPNTLKIKTLSNDGDFFRKASHLFRWKIPMGQSCGFRNRTRRTLRRPRCRVSRKTKPRPAAGWTIPYRRFLLQEWHLLRRTQFQPAVQRKPLVPAQPQT